MSKNKQLLIIVGPTASGKSNFGVFLAKSIGGEVISADSRQVYKGLNIGSGKITKKEMGGIPHHCLNIANPKKVFTAYNFQKCAWKAIEKIQKKNKIPIIVGGTGFYIDSVTGKVNLSNVHPNPKLRKQLSKHSTIQLFSLLKRLDPKRAKNIDKNNRVRLVRAIEISLTPTPSLTLGYSLASLTLRRSGPFVRGRNILWIGIKRSREELKKRIHKRLLRRIQGIINEVRMLHKNGLSWKRFFDLGLEYRYVSLYLRKKEAAPHGASLASLRREMTKKLETEINKYAKRQMTYWRRNKEIQWVSEKKAKNLGRRFASA